MAPKKFRTEFNEDEVNRCLAQLKNRKAAGADERVDGFPKYGREGVPTMIAMLYGWI